MRDGLILTQIFDPDSVMGDSRMVNRAGCTKHELLEGTEANYHKIGIKFDNVLDQYEQSTPSGNEQ